MVIELTYHTVSSVVESWEALRRIPDYEEKAGILIFRKFFTIEPRALKVFSFGKDINEVDDKLIHDSRFIAHSKHYVKMVDRAVGLLGPDIELLTAILMELGLQHHKFGVEASFYPPMGQALIATMEELLGDKFKAETKEAWFECYQAMGYDMMRGGKNLKSP